MARRTFVRLIGLGAATAMMPELPAFAGPFVAQDFDTLVPRDKKLRPEWVQALSARGKPEVYTGHERDYVGMPVGGIACGQLYLGGDGRLWYWDIFRAITSTDYDSRIWAGPHYEHPMHPNAPLTQGFALRVTADGKTETHALDSQGFSDVTFRGEYPVGRVTYRDANLPVEATLEAFSPFIPLNVEDSSIPATVLSFTVRNTGKTPAQVDIAGWLENAVCRYGDGGLTLQRRNTVQREAERLSLLSGVEHLVDPAVQRPDIVFEDFENGYGKWKAEGEAFGTEPATGTLDNQQPVQGFSGKRLVNSYRGGDDATGKLTSPSFVISRRRIAFLIGGGNRPGQACVNLLVDGKVVRTATGQNDEKLQPASWNVVEFEGKQAQIEIVDQATGAWGHINIDQIVFSDRPVVETPEELPGFGSMALTLLGGAGPTFVVTDLGASFEPDKVFARLDQNHVADTVKPLEQKLVGALGQRFTLPPGGQATANFVLSWWFPFYHNVNGEMAAITDIKKLARHYARRFDGADSVAAYVTEQFDRLAGQTRLWNTTWYDSTLPYWFLDRTFIPVNSLATQTLHAFDSGRWWAWEGVDCCPGTCQHVWQYAQSVARLFPAIERDLRERVDFGLAWREDGAMGFRAENDRNVAQDGFCGTLLRVYREHQMSPNRAFLHRLWPRIRKSLEFILAQDKDADGLLEGEQMNTLDAAWYGPMAWISSLYLGALAAGEAMAEEMGDPGFAARCRQVLDAGRRNLITKLYNGEYFIHLPPDFKHTNTNVGCHSDQMLGQSMAFPLGLPRLVSEPEAKSALKALWTYNFTPDVGLYHRNFKTIPGGRVYAMAGEGGMIVCTWPRGGAAKAGGGNPTFVGYFNECWTGFEYQVASQMLWEGMITEGLAITRAVHDRYHPAKRNPYNEIECSDHYARAMSSYGVFLAACGFEHHGPKGHIGFAPRLAPDDFRAPFTTAEGWGTFAQKRDGATQQHTLAIQWGQMRVKSLAFVVADNAQPTKVVVTVAEKPVNATLTLKGHRAEIQLASEANIEIGQTLKVVLT